MDYIKINQQHNLNELQNIEYIYINLNLTASPIKINDNGYKNPEQLTKYNFINKQQISDLNIYKINSILYLFKNKYQNGGFKNKYLKYKKKYLLLKNKININNF